jgi:hypothetical protein
MKRGRGYFIFSIYKIEGPPFQITFETKKIDPPYPILAARLDRISYWLLNGLCPSTAIKRTRTGPKIATMPSHQKILYQISVVEQLSIQHIRNIYQINLHSSILEGVDKEVIQKFSKVCTETQ